MSEKEERKEGRGKEGRKEGREGRKEEGGREGGRKEGKKGERERQITVDACCFFPSDSVLTVCPCDITGP